MGRMWSYLDVKLFYVTEVKLVSIQTRFYKFRVLNKNLYGNNKKNNLKNIPKKGYVMGVQTVLKTIQLNMREDNNEGNQNQKSIRYTKKTKPQQNGRSPTLLVITVV